MNRLKLLLCVAVGWLSAQAQEVIMSDAWGVLVVNTASQHKAQAVTTGDIPGSKVWHRLNMLHSLEVVEADSVGTLFQDCQVLIQFSQGIVEKWEEGGHKKTAMHRHRSVSRLFHLLNADSKLENIQPLGEESNDYFIVDFCKRNDTIVEKKEYKLHVIAKLQPSGTVVGGVTFVVRGSGHAREELLVDTAHDATAQVFEVGNIAYRPVGEDAETVEVTARQTVTGNWYDEVPYTGRTLTIPEVVSHDGVDYTVTGIGTSAFFRSKQVEFVSLPNSVSSIGDYAFSECCGMKEVSFSQGLQTIAPYAFEECVSLQELYFPNGLRSIGDYAFCGCKELRLLSLPQELQTIGGCAFANCVNLQNVYCPIEKPDQMQTDEHAFDGAWQFVLYVRSNGSRDAYRRTTPWSSHQVLLYSPTGIAALEEMPHQGSAPAYSLQGVRLQKLPSRGVVIRDGKKVIVR